MSKPTPEQLRLAVDTLLPDVIAPGLRILFCGINPGLYSAAMGQHFARPGNRFWPALHLGGVTPRLLAPAEQDLLPALGYGITNVVDRATAAAAELTAEELVAGRRQLEAKVRQHAPRVLAVLGISAYRTAFGVPQAVLGRQAARIGETVVWVLPNPSGLNAHYQRDELAQWFRAVRLAAEA